MLEAILGSCLSHTFSTQPISKSCQLHLEDVSILKTVVSDRGVENGWIRNGCGVCHMLCLKKKRNKMKNFLCSSKKYREQASIILIPVTRTMHAVAALRFCISPGLHSLGQGFLISFPDAVRWRCLSYHFICSKEDLLLLYEVWLRHRCRNMPFHVPSNLMSMPPPLSQCLYNVMFKEGPSMRNKLDGDQQT